jgi:hypothetical protein
MTITKLTYRCDRESLGGVDESAFVDALENELMAIPQFRESSVEVEFGTHKSGLHSVRGFDLSDDPVAELSDRVRDAAERAWNVCLAEA